MQYMHCLPLHITGQVEVLLNYLRKVPSFTAPKHSVLGPQLQEIDDSLLNHVANSIVWQKDVLQDGVKQFFIKKLIWNLCVWKYELVETVTQIEFHRPRGANGTRLGISYWWEFVCLVEFRSYSWVIGELD